MIATTEQLALPERCENTPQGFSCNGTMIEGVHVGLDPTGERLIVRSVGGEVLWEQPWNSPREANHQRRPPLSQQFAEARDDRGFQHTTDMGNARRLALRAAGRLLHVHGLGWMAWSGRRWERALSGQEVREAKQMVRSIHGEAATIQRQASDESDEDERKKLSAIADGYSKWARSSEFASRIGAAITLTRSESELVGEVNELDAHPNLLNVRNGTLDLDVGHRQRLLHRRLDPVEPHEVGGLLDVVDDVVDLPRQAVNVLAVDRRDEVRVDTVGEVVGDPVSLLLGKQDLACETGALGPALEHLPEQLRRPDRVPTGLREQVEEDAIRGD